MKEDSKNLQWSACSFFSLPSFFFILRYLRIYIYIHPYALSYHRFGTKLISITMWWPVISHSRFFQSILGWRRVADKIRTLKAREGWFKFITFSSFRRKLAKDEEATDTKSTESFFCWKVMANRYDGTRSCHRWNVTLSMLLLLNIFRNVRNSKKLKTLRLFIISRLRWKSLVRFSITIIIFLITFSNLSQVVNVRMSSAW